MFPHDIGEGNTAGRIVQGIVIGRGHRANSLAVLINNDRIGRS
ncbi:hypothetical protein FRUB_00119 [Fimbriiglobus ruber]|uniref:Uncharacterized protein n=1 Tax=Fimbriiglobus ruber TaxID=1908690 RepID=A0A225DY08_9BACT|nr:hypothetical protein FRUB_00119 [Fimbriiglobus ruber]